MLLEKEISGGSIDLKALIRREGAKGSAVGEADVELLRKMEPLKGGLFCSIYAVSPCIQHIVVVFSIIYYKITIISA